MGSETDSTQVVLLADVDRVGDRDVFASNLGRANRLYQRARCLEAGTTASITSTPASRCGAKMAAVDSSCGYSGSPCAVNGLTNGTAHTFPLTATNGVGTGPASAPSDSVTPRAPQAIAFDPLPIRALGTPPFMGSATGGGSGIPVTFASQTTSIGSTSGKNGSTVTVLSLAGRLCPTQPAEDVDQSFEVARELMFGDGFED